MSHPFLARLGSIICTLGLIMPMSACDLPGLSSQTNDQTPAVAISNPAPQQELAPGQEVKVQSVSVGNEGIVRVELTVDGQVVWTNANADPQPDTPFIVAQPWTPNQPGQHMLQVRAYDLANQMGQSEPVPVQVISQSAATEATATPSQIQAALASPTPPAPTPIPATGPTATSPLLPSPTATPLPVTLSPDSQATASPTLAPPASPTPTLPIFEPTGLRPDGHFKDIWLALGNGQGRLGYPLTPQISGRNYARQYFEGGLMYWWDNPEAPDYIWAISDPVSPEMERGSRFQRYPDSWAGGEEVVCEAAREGGPVRGFGQVWCDQPALQEALGYPREPESGSGGRAPFADLQFFQGGVIFSNPANQEIYVLFNQGGWQRFEE